MRMLAVVLLGATAAGGGAALHPGPGDVRPVRDTTVAIKTFRFRPSAVVIPVGTRVIWSNADEIEHTVTAGIPDSAAGAFDGTLAAQGASFAHTFNRSGTFSYYCGRHHFMRGEIRVTSRGEN